MPKININLTDNTGVDYTGKEQVIFFPGSVAIKNGSADDNSCVLISTADANNLENCLNFSETKSDDVLAKYMIKSYLSRGYEVLYHYCGDSLGNIDFLKDKDNYNVKFLTLGIHNPIKATVTEATEEENSKDSIAFDFGKHDKLVEIAADRKDCVVVSGVDYETSSLTKINASGDVFADCIQAALSGNETVSNVEDGEITVSGAYNAENGEFAYLLVPNRVKSFKISGKDANLTLPAGFAYLMALGYSNINSTQWLPTANSSRGNVAVYGKSDIKMTKYHFDNQIILDEGVVAFNGITYLRPYGDVIWGDRTLLKLGSSVKATGYMSLMLVICDISKEAYNAAVRYTYESNNEVTWLNYKTRIVKLLDQMVTAGVLQSYKVAKVATENLNEIKAKITIKPNLPVENFDITVDLQNADLTVED